MSFSNIFDGTSIFSKKFFFLKTKIDSFKSFKKDFYNKDFFVNESLYNKIKNIEFNTNTKISEKFSYKFCNHMVFNYLDKIDNPKLNDLRDIICLYELEIENFSKKIEEDIDYLSFIENLLFDEDKNRTIQDFHEMSLIPDKWFVIFQNKDHPFFFHYEYHKSLLHINILINKEFELIQTYKKNILLKYNLLDSELPICFRYLDFDNRTLNHLLKYLSKKEHPLLGEKLFFHLLNFSKLQLNPIIYHSKFGLFNNHFILDNLYVNFILVSLEKFGINVNLSYMNTLSYQIKEDFLFFNHNRVYEYIYYKCNNFVKEKEVSYEEFLELYKKYNPEFIDLNETPTVPLVENKIPIEPVIENYLMAYTVPQVENETPTEPVVENNAILPTVVENEIPNINVQPYIPHLYTSKDKEKLNHLFLGDKIFSFLKNNFIFKYFFKEDQKPNCYVDKVPFYKVSDIERVENKELRIGDIFFKKLKKMFSNVFNDSQFQYVDPYYDNNLMYQIENYFITYFGLTENSILFFYDCFFEFLSIIIIYFILFYKKKIIGIYSLLFKRK